MSQTTAGLIAEARGDTSCEQNAAQQAALDESICLLQGGLPVECAELKARKLAEYLAECDEV